MADFRTLLGSLGHTDVATYLQSGNAVFTSNQRSAATLASGIEHGLTESLDVDVRALVVSQTRLKRIVNDNPMLGSSADPSYLHVAFLSGVPKAALVKQIDRDSFSPDRFEVHGDVVYLLYPNGMGRSKLDPGKVFGRLGVWATARNWRTVHALVDLAAST